MQIAHNVQFSFTKEYSLSKMKAIEILNTLIRPVGTIGS